MKISVCIPTYNQANYVEKAVKSAFLQTLTPTEIIVSDDCSTDATLSVLQKLAVEIPILKIYRQSDNQGIAKNTDHCLRSAIGDIIVRLDSDDYLSPEYIERLSALLQKCPNAGYAHCAIQEVDEKGNFLKERRLFRKEVCQSADDALKSAVFGYRVAANVIMFKREALVRADYLRGRANFAEDYHLTASISSMGFANAYDSEILAYYRVWVDAGKARQKRKLAEINGLRRVFEEVLEPSFKSRNWNVNVIERSKANYACIQADCLGWNIYNNQEKKELAVELEKLSASKKAKTTVWMYLNGAGFILTGYSKMVSFFKQIAKKIIAGLRS